MPPPTQTWFSLIKEELPTLDAFLRKFVELYAPLKDKHGYQRVSASSARFFYSAGERKEMFELLDACIEDAKHPLKPSMKIHAPPPLTAAYQPYPFKLEPNYAYGPDTSVPDGVDEPHLNEAQTEALKEKSHESEYMPNGWEQHAHASSGANSLAHPLLHNYSHRQRAIYGI
ncbi:hypothetical protein NBRC10513v2_007778 [Rhodotorula toruloides]